MLENNFFEQRVFNCCTCLGKLSEYIDKELDAKDMKLSNMLKQSARAETERKNTFDMRSLIQEYRESLDEGNTVLATLISGE